MHYLSDQDLKNWLAAATTRPDHAQNPLPWVELHLRQFFPFEKVFMAYGELVAGEIKTSLWLSSGHDQRYLAQLKTQFELAQRGSMQWWFVHRKPFVIDPAAPPEFVTPFELDEIQEFGLRNVAAHGVLNGRSSGGTFFSFAGVCTPLSNWHLEALHLIAPVLNDLFLDYMAAQPQPQAILAGLGAKQNQVVRLVAQGLDDKTIGKRLGISEKTVRNRLTEVYARVGVSKRTQLLALLR